MGNLALRVEGLGKMYRIGGKQERYSTLRDTITDVVSAPFKRARSLVHGEAYGAAGLKEEIWALKDISFEVQHGEAVGIIGRNGAGKSTLLKILSRITEPTAGYAEVYGRVGSLLEVGTGFHPELTGRENVYLNGAILGMSRAEIDRKFDEIVDFAEIEKFIDTPVKHYSSGMGLRLGFAVAAHLEPDILVVDEVLAVGDTEFQKKCLGKMSEVAGEGRTVLFVSHNMEAVERLCSSALLLESGKIVDRGPSRTLVERYIGSARSEASDQVRGKWPVFNPSGSVGISDVRAIVFRDSSGQAQALKIEIGIVARKRFVKLGVGITFWTMRGMLVSSVGPTMIDSTLSDAQGCYQCAFFIEDIGQRLAGGDYFITVWLSHPRVEFFLRVDEAALVTLPLQQFGTILFEANRYGVVPLPATFESYKDSDVSN